MNGVGTMNQTMAPVGSSDAMNEEQVRNVRIAMSKGYKFIRLVHHKPGSIPERVYPVDGIMVTVRHNSMTKTNESHVSQREGREVLFVPDPDTGVRSAFILDTTHNRKFLASHLLEDRWFIEDPQVLQEIKEIESKMERVIDTTKMHETANSQPVVTKEEVVQGMSEKQLADQIAEKRKELEMLTSAQEKKKGTKEEIPVEKKAAPDQIVSNELKDKIPSDILDRATSLVYQRNATTIAGLKAKHGDEDFINSDEFQKNIQPQIDAELLKVMNEAQGVTETEEVTEENNADDEGASSGASV